MMYSYHEITALVTGASSGIGDAIAQALAQRRVGGLILVARSVDKMERLAEELRERHGTVVNVIAADLSRPSAPQELKAETDRRGLRVDLLVNNAGFGSYGLFTTRPAEQEVDMVMVNVAAVVGLTRLYLPEIVARGRGGVLTVASTAAFQPVPYMATYGATKAFVLSFTEALWAEMRDGGHNNIHVSCLCPGMTATEFGANVGSDRGRMESLPAATAEEVAEAGLTAWERNAPSFIYGAANAAGAFSVRLAPRPMVARMGALLMRPTGTPKPSRAPLGIALCLLVGLGGIALPLWAKSQHNKDL
jgi:short-subunit dehydrogenase